ncbi:MAG: C39 family peptidase [Candidatus Paceibacterota bacterium]|jgi:hypothetical protein
MRLVVPYISQYLDVSDPYWKDRSCSVACLWMALSMKRKMPPLDILVPEAARKYGYDPARGWTHEAIVSLFADYGVRAERKEFKTDELFRDGVREIIASLSSGNPVLISAIKNWKEEKNFHTVLFVGFDADEKGDIFGFYYHDSASEDREKGQNLFVPFDTFKKYWRRLAVFPKL